MVTQDLILKVLYQLNQRKANTSLAMIACILKGDKNSICSQFQDIKEFGLVDEKAMKNHLLRIGRSDNVWYHISFQKWLKPYHKQMYPVEKKYSAQQQVLAMICQYGFAI